MTRSRRFLPWPSAATIPAPWTSRSHRPRSSSAPTAGRARGPRSPARPAFGRHREGFAAHLEWSAPSSTPSTRWSPGPANTAAAEATLWSADLRGGVLTRGAPQRVTQNGIFLLAPTVFQFGTQEQKTASSQRWPRASRRGARDGPSQNAGSDLAESRARPCAKTRQRLALVGPEDVDDAGAFCTHMFGLFRSDPAAERHQGLTYFLVDLQTPGVTVRPVERLDGDEGFAEYSSMTCSWPDADVLGDPNQGWAVAMATTGSERASPAVTGPLHGHGATPHRLARDHAQAAETVDDAWRERLTAAWIDAQGTAGRPSRPSRASRRGRRPGPSRAW